MRRHRARIVIEWCRSPWPRSLILEPARVALNAAHVGTIQQRAAFVFRHDERVDLSPHRDEAQRQMRANEAGRARDEDAPAAKRLLQAP